MTRVKRNKRLIHESWRGVKLNIRIHVQYYKTSETQVANQSGGPVYQANFTVKELSRKLMNKLNGLTGFYFDEKHPRIMKFKEGVAVIWKINKTAKEGPTLRRICSESGLFRGEVKRPENAGCEEGSETITLLTNKSAIIRRNVKVEHSPMQARTEIIPVKSCLRQEQQGVNKTPSRNCRRVTFSMYALILSAASQNAISELKDILDKKPSYINKPSSSGETALHKSAAKGNLECVKLLVKRGANVELADKQGRTPLFLSWKNGHFECHKLMLTSLKQSNRDDFAEKCPWREDSPM